MPWESHFWAKVFKSAAGTARFTSKAGASPMLNQTMAYGDPVVSGDFPYKVSLCPNGIFCFCQGKSTRNTTDVCINNDLQPNRKHYLGRRWQFFGRLPAGRSTPQLFEEHSLRIDQRVCCSIPGCFWPSLERIRLFSPHFRVLQCLLLPFCEGLATAVSYTHLTLPTNREV